MGKPRYPKLSDYEGVQIESDEIFRFACCDCGLVHDMAAVVVKKKTVEIAFRRFNRGTAQLRRHRFGSLQQRPINGWQMTRAKRLKK